MITTYLARLNAREKLVLYGAGLFVIFAFFDRLVVGPIITKMKSLDEHIVQERELYRKNARIVAEKDKVAAVKKQLSGYSRKVGTQEEEVAFLLGEVEKIARKTSLYIVDMKPLGIQEDGVSRKYSVDLNCEAQMEQIMNFMYEIENSSMLFFVESFNITPKSKDSSVAKCNLRIANLIFL
jgi:Tfp pilus assembly protein PilO